MRFKNYRTSDMSLAAFLMTSGCKLVEARMEEDEKNKVLFAFEWNDNIPRLKTAFFTKEGKVVAIDYFANIKSLKTLIHSELEYRKDNLEV